MKVALKFRGREMAHTEFGFQVIQKFLDEIAPYGHPDFEPKLIGRGINVMISPLPRNKRAKPPEGRGGESTLSVPQPHAEPDQQAVPLSTPRPPRPEPQEVKSDGFLNNPFAEVEVNR